MEAAKIEKPIMTKEEYNKVAHSLRKKHGAMMFKRLFDLVVSFIMLVLFFPLLLVISVLIILNSGAPVLFRQERIGKAGQTFNIYKFRTMRNNTGTSDGITLQNDNRITKIGTFLRKYRLDEIPQLLNIIKGEMSFVGPRPDLPKYYEVDDFGYKCVLLVKPGVTGEATLEFRNEDETLAKSNNPEKQYIEEIFPRKVRLNIEYIKKISVSYDIKIMVATFLRVFVRN